MTTTFVGVAGLPRAGSTLLCRMLAMHPEIHCEHQGSPVGKLLGGRHVAGDDPFMHSRDDDFDIAYGHLQSAMEEFMCGWHHSAGDKKAVVDKNLAWLLCLELLLFLVPDAKLIVCLRELGQIHGSIEALHPRTMPSDSIEDLFAKDKGVGAPLVALHVIPDLPKAVQDRVYFLRFEDMMEKPAACLSDLFAWLDLPPFDIDLESLATHSHESGSHCRQSTRLATPAQHAIPLHIQAQIQNAYAWYYELYYPK